MWDVEEEQVYEQAGAIYAAVFEGYLGRDDANLTEVAMDDLESFYSATTDVGYRGAEATWFADDVRKTITTSVHTSEEQTEPHIHIQLGGVQYTQDGELLHPYRAHEGIGEVDCDYLDQTVLSVPLDEPDSIATELGEAVDAAVDVTPDALTEHQTYDW